MRKGETVVLLSSFLKDCAAAPDVELSHFLCVSQSGVLAQYTAPPYRMDVLRLCYSMTKSFASLAVGIAWDGGLLDLDGLVGDILPDCMPKDRSCAAWKIRVRDLLTMSSGIGENTYAALFGEPDWVRAYLHQDFPHAPGTFYQYSTHGSHVLSALVERVSGMSLEEFLNRKLFYPMGILEAQWERAPEGRTAGGMGLSLYPESLAKIARLLLNRGMWDGRRLISERYLEMASSVQIVKQDHRPEDIYGGDGYGFQFHIGKGGFYRMDGAFGQVCLICPERDLAFVALSSGSKTESLLRLIYTHFLEKAVPHVPTGVYSMGENPLHIRTVSLTRNADDYLLCMQTDGGAREIRFCPDGETAGRTVFIKDLQEHEQAYVCRASLGAALTLTVYYIETPYVAAYRFRPTDAGVRMEFEINVSFTLKAFAADGVRCE